MRLTPEEDFSAANIIHASMDDAPRDEFRIIVARDAAGQIEHIHWRKFPDLEDAAENPYWAVTATDEEFEPVAWAESSMTQDELWVEYCA